MTRCPRRANWGPSAPPTRPVPITATVSAATVGSKQGPISNPVNSVEMILILNRIESISRINRIGGCVPG